MSKTCKPASEPCREALEAIVDFCRKNNRDNEFLWIKDIAEAALSTTVSIPKWYDERNIKEWLDRKPQEITPAWLAMHFQKAFEKGYQVAGGKETLSTTGERVLYDEVMRCEGDAQDSTGEYNTQFSKGADWFYTQELHHRFKAGDTIRVRVTAAKEGG